MWWFDRKSVAVGEQLRDLFGVDVFVETGTFRGVNLKFWSYRFRAIIGVEKNQPYADMTWERLIKTGRSIENQVRFS